MINCLRIRPAIACMQLFLCATIPVLAQTAKSALAPAPPVVTSPVRYCQGGPSWNLGLAVNTSPGAALHWWGTNATGGTWTPNAPTIPTTSLGSTTYYVSQADATGESPRAAIVVEVVTSITWTHTEFFCDPPKNTPTTVFFDWTNITGHGLYHYTYSINGGPPVSGSQAAPSSIYVPVPGPNSAVTFTMTAVDNFPCFQPKTITCGNCSTSVMPAFAGFATSYCQGNAAPALPTTSTNGTPITGTWSPSAISTTTPGTTNYHFTPDEAFPCASEYDLPITITPGNIQPAFAFPANVSLCSGAATVPVLANTSSNGVTGTWNPPTVSNTASGTYTFTSTAGQCAANFVLNVTVTPQQTLQFTNLPAAGFTICQNATPPALPLLSNNTTPISGTWSPSSINTSVPGLVTTYTFTANPGQCVASPTYSTTVTVTPLSTPVFSALQNLSFCNGTTPVPQLPALSDEGYVGSWSPSSIDNTQTRQYIFTPAANQCANTVTITVTVTPLTVPAFSPVAPFCAGSTAPALPPASTNTPPITGQWSPSAIDNTASGDYVFVPDAGQCADLYTLHVTVDQPADPDFADIVFCENEPVPLLPPVSPNGYIGTWNPAVIDGTNIAPEYIFTPDAGQCANPQSIQVKQNLVTLTDATWTVSSFFEDGTVQVLAVDQGNYLYQLDHGPLQVSDTFTHVPPGLHSFTVYDANGCASPVVKEDVIQIIGYPKFFTPNGDGTYDTWNITDLRDAGQPQAQIFIFDRYGKLLKQIAPGGAGWDGTYNGQPMPASDYWFMVKYAENGQALQYRAHFSLKR